MSEITYVINETYYSFTACAAFFNFRSANCLIHKISEKERERQQIDINVGKIKQSF